MARRVFVYFLMQTDIIFYTYSANYNPSTALELQNSKDSFVERTNFVDRFA